MFRKLLAIASLAGALGLAACESYGPTPYQPGDRYTGGYSETRIESDRFRIAFRGNSLTDRETVENYMLYRAAELTLQQGYDNFTVVSRDTDRDRRVRSSPGYAHRYLNYAYFVPRYGWVYDYDYWVTPPTYSESTRYEAFAEIMMSRGPKGSDSATFNAREVQANLANTVIRPPPA